jgi:hypothetical protein
LRRGSVVDNEKVCDTPPARFDDAADAVIDMLSAVNDDGVGRDPQSTPRPRRWEVSCVVHCDWRTFYM